MVPSIKKKAVCSGKGQVGQVSVADDIKEW